LISTIHSLARRGGARIFYGLFGVALTTSAVLATVVVRRRMLEEIDEDKTL
jgi:hypothetical protein